MPDNAAPELVATQQGRVLQVIIKNPSSRNALTREMFTSAE
jgi:enoyl-CoA hydratase/carnithine racemase